MSSFKRRETTATARPSGTKISPFNSLPLLSTGLSALDDLLGGGLPLSSSLLLESDEYTSHAELLLKYWIAQGLESKQQIIIVGNDLDDFVESLMGVEGGDTVESEDEVDTTADKLKIAFRYEGMKRVGVPAAVSGLRTPSIDTYCSMFDLTTILPLRVSDRNRLHLIDIDQRTDLDDDPYERLFDLLSEMIISLGCTLPQDPTKPRSALRIALRSFASPLWGNSSPSNLYRFLHRLRTLLRTSSASAVITFPAYLYTATSPSLVRRIEYTADGVIELSSFAGSPARLASFPKHNGLLRIPSLPSLGSLVPPSAKLSVLRGLGGGGNGESGGGGLDLGFRIKRRRFIIEPLRDDSGIEGVVPVKPVAKKVITPANKTNEGEIIERSSKVRFAGEEESSLPTTQSKPVSISALLHKTPELYEF